MRQRRGLAAFLLVLLLCSITALPAGAVDTGQITFAAEEPDANGCFTMTLRVANAKFHAFQFVLRYDKNTVIPVSWKDGAATESFSDFAKPAPDTAWMATIGTEVDTKAGLIDFTGYVTPGESPVVDREKIDGAANLGETGHELFSFRFKRVGTEPVKIEIGSRDTGTAYREYLPDGGGLAFAGERQPAKITISLPKSLGTTTTVDAATDSPVTPPTTPATPPQETIAPIDTTQRLRGTIILQIDNYAAAADGALVRIDPTNKAVVPLLQEGRTYVPIRFIAEYFGAQVHWESATRSAVIEQGGKVIKMPIDSKTFTVDGVKKTMDAAAQLREGRTMVPIRFVAEALGKAVEWDKNLHVAVIAPGDAPWIPGGAAETAAGGDVLVLLSPLVRDLIG
ncbi:MAG: stalk domain-containing protein [Oscillospiraceae bacterium]